MTGLTDVHAPFDRAVALLADLSADFEATAKRCEAPEVAWPTLAKERRIEGDAIRNALVAILAAELVFEGTPAGEAQTVAIERTAELIHAATARRDKRAGAA